MNPRTSIDFAAAADLKLWKGRGDESNRLVDIANVDVRMFQPSCHNTAFRSKMFSTLPRSMLGILTRRDDWTPIVTLYRPHCQRR
jgi:hypothetical protein